MRRLDRGLLPTAGERYVQAFNNGDLETLSSLVSPDYTYTEGRLGGTQMDLDAHLGLIRSLLERFPDRRVTVLRRFDGDDSAVVEYRWEGTPNAGGDPVTMSICSVFTTSAGQISSHRTYYG